MRLKATEKLLVMTKTNDAKFDEKSTCRFHYLGNLTNFEASTRNSEKFAL